MYKMAFFDIDGTIYTNNQSILKSTVYAIEGLRKKGIKIALATGRSYHAAESCAKQLGIDIRVHSNGSYVVCDNKVVHKAPCSVETVVKFHHLSDKLQLGTTFYTQDRVYRNNHRVQEVEKFHDMHDLGGTHVVRDFKGIEVYGMSLYALRNETLRHRELFPDLHFIEMYDHIQDIIPKNISKYSGIQAILDYYKINEEEVIAFGDGMNDVEMLQYLGMGIAMGNANEEVKKKAKYVTTSNENDGILLALKNFKIL